MKNRFLLLLCSIGTQALAQSITITPNNGTLANYPTQQITVQTANDETGFEHSSGPVSLITKIKNNTAILMTKTNHPLYFAVNSFIDPSMVLTTTGRVGIGTTNPTEKLHVDGTVRISSLAGTGTRYVKADANGVLTTNVVTNYLQVPRSSFLAVSGNAVSETSNGGIYCTGANTGFLEAPIQLPDGAVITGFTGYYVDNSAKNIYIGITRRAYTGGNPTILGSFISSGASGNTNIINNSVVITDDNVIDNNSYVYYIRVAVFSANIASSWDGTALTLNQIKLTYSY